MTDMKSDPVSGDAIPDLLKVGAIPSSYGQTLTTDVIDPVTFSQQRVRFTLSRVAGFLHSNSKITLAITPLTATTAFYPLNIGVSNLIQSAALRVGNKTVCEIDDYTHFHQYQSLFISNEDNKEREQFLSQRCINHGCVYENFGAAADDQNPNSATKIGIDIGRNPIVPANGTAGAFKLFPHMLHDAANPTRISEAPVYSVYLSDLFPFLRVNQLPMFMLNEEVHIDITFTPVTSVLSGGALSRRMCVGSADNANDAVEYQINENEVKLIYDSISYDGAVMEQYRQQNPKLTFSYVDYRLAKRTGDENAFSDLTFPLGGNGRLVNKVLFALTPASSADPKSLLNNVVARDVPVGNDVSVNLLYNDLFEFNVDRKNTALLFHTTQHAEGKVPMVTRDEYQTTGVSALTAETLEGRAQNSVAGLRGLMRWTAIKPNKGQRVNNKGMDLIYKAPGLGADNYTLRAYLELVKIATVQDGVFDCYFA